MADNKNSNTKEPEVQGSGDGGNPEKTFTQKELDEIVENRLMRERSKYANYDEIVEKAKKFDETEEANKSELQKATEKISSLESELEKRNKKDEIREIRATVGKELNVPSDLLVGETEEECRAYAKKLVTWSGGLSKYPDVSKDGGDPDKGAKMTKEEILKIKDEKKRLKAIEENIDLFK